MLEEENTIEIEEFGNITQRGVADGRSLMALPNTNETIVIVGTTVAGGGVVAGAGLVVGSGVSAPFIGAGVLAGFFGGLGGVAMYRYLNKNDEIKTVESIYNDLKFYNGKLSKVANSNFNMEKTKKMIERYYHQVEGGLLYKIKDILRKDSCKSYRDKVEEYKQKCRELLTNFERIMANMAGHSPMSSSIRDQITSMVANFTLPSPPPHSTNSIFQI